MERNRGPILPKKKRKSKSVKKRIRVSSAKNKGRRLQYWVCSKIAELTGYEWGRDKPIESRPMGQPGVDVRLEKSVEKLFPFSVECKWHENWSVHNWIRQARKNIKKGTYWLIIAKRSRDKPVVIMDAENFFDLLKTKKKND